MEISDSKPEGFFYTAGPALISGAAQAILFNPFDRALYVRVKHRRQYFLDRRNFEHPFQGFMNAAVYRTLVGASYMFFQDSARIFIEKCLPDRVHASHAPQFNAFLIGFFAGCLNGAVLNGLQVVKYRMWNGNDNNSFWNVTWGMYQENGWRIFFRGIGATALRDCVFGVVYETVRRATAFKDFLDSYVMSAERRAQGMHEESPNCEVCEMANSSATHTSGVHTLWSRERCGTCAFISNLIAALLASVMSSPFNYVRSVIYGAPSGSVPMRYWPLLHSFFLQTLFIYRYGESFTDAKADAKTAHHHVNHSPVRGRHLVAAFRWANSRLSIGWGSVRVGLGMAIGQSLFHMAQNAVQVQSTRRAN